MITIHNKNERLYICKGIKSSTFKLVEDKSSNFKFWVKMPYEREDFEVYIYEDEEEEIRYEEISFICETKEDLDKKLDEIKESCNEYTKASINIYEVEAFKFYDNCTF